MPAFAGLTRRCDNRQTINMACGSWARTLTGDTDDPGHVADNPALRILEILWVGIKFQRSFDGIDREPGTGKRSWRKLIRKQSGSRRSRRPQSPRSRP